MPKTMVCVTSKTWVRDSHDLYDFETQHVHTQTFDIPRAMSCVRIGTDVQAIDMHVPVPAGGECLFRVPQRDGVFFLDKAAGCEGSKKLWLVVRDLALGCHELAEGDVMKLGRFKFRVRQMVGDKDSTMQPQLKLDSNDIMTAVAPNLSPSQQAAATCRICLLEGAGDEDPLIAPCACKGSIAHVHLGCLRHWVNLRLNLSDTSGGSFFYRPLSCELCKSNYPVQVSLGPDKVPLVEVPKISPPFIVLENMVRDSQQHSTRGLHVISLAEKKVLKLGRGHESDVRIADVSISRCHATIRAHNGQFLLEDHNSKFGTLVAMKKPKPLQAGHELSVQIGRTVVSLTLQQKSSNGDIQVSSQTGLVSNIRDERALRLSLLMGGALSTREPAEEDAQRDRHLR